MKLEDKTDFPSVDIKEFPPFDPKELGRIIKTRRKQMKLNQETLAKKVGVTSTYISLLENNHKKFGNLDLLNRISNELEIPYAYLLFLSIEEKGKYKERIRLIKDIIKGEYFSII
jgi:transcriptional regulator with XRE-family HTH domain